MLNLAFWFVCLFQVLLAACAGKRWKKRLNVQFTITTTEQPGRSVRGVAHQFRGLNSCFCLLPSGWLFADIWMRVLRMGRKEHFSKLALVADVSVVRVN